MTDAGGNNPLVIDSEDLVTQPEETMAAYCHAVGIPHLPDALHWQSGDRHEWTHSARWHVAVAASSGFEERSATYDYGPETMARLDHMAAQQVPFYEALREHKLHVTPKR